MNSSNVSMRVRHLLSIKTLIVAGSLLPIGNHSATFPGG